MYKRRCNNDLSLLGFTVSFVPPKVLVFPPFSHRDDDDDDDDISADVAVSDVSLPRKPRDV